MDPWLTAKYFAPVMLLPPDVPAAGSVLGMRLIRPSDRRRCCGSHSSPGFPQNSSLANHSEDLLPLQGLTWAFSGCLAAAQRRTAYLWPAIRRDGELSSCQGGCGR